MAAKPGPPTPHQARVMEGRPLHLAFSPTITREEKNYQASPFLFNPRRLQNVYSNLDSIPISDFKMT
jgi:hypothetical protein